MLLCNFMFSGTEVLIWQIVESYARWRSSHHVNWCETKWLKRFTSNWKSWWSLLVYPLLSVILCFTFLLQVFFFGGVFPFVFPLCFSPFYVVSQYHGWVFLLLPDLQQRTMYTGSWLHWPIPTVGRLMKSVLVLVQVVMRCCSSKTPIETFLSLVGTRSLHP
jgi:hypothetical protein